MIYNLLKNALLAWLLHAGASFVLDAREPAPAFAAVAPAASCNMPMAASIPIAPAAAHADSLHAIQTLAGAQS